jgi:nucleoside-diphosphate-sugar epimerase
VVLDREVPEELARALARGADAVIDTVAYTAAHAEQLLQVQDHVGAFVVISSASVYRDDEGRTLDESRATGFPELPEPIPETHPTVNPGPTTYSTQKVALERQLLDHARVPVTVLRPCAIHGPGSVHPREWWFIKRMLDGRTAIPLAYKGQSRFHTSSVLNIAALVCTALENPGTRILNAADPEALTVARIGNAISSHLAYTGTLVPIATDGHPAPVGATPWSVPRPFVLDTQAALSLGYRPEVSYEETVSATCDWIIRQAAGRDWHEVFPVLASYPRNLFDYEAEDALMASEPFRMLEGQNFA